ncbi:uncharacterized protein MELLADRAFT_91256 [Melampsora larici-populina 98AG31]|uniref:Uncharacterized protein n=1 Tax=Melampsora larici-populina (strain 98AG31 / pathotype 3-4-7) TaxID=747676 RepID=F4RYD9_MELLP|nr:uncharacterized protein MELLADRAFT_91256 [Melampsora larici-populina 98AG31]EGG02451.1 hypothetical protein MELLADRAFT_91256 [Melampsora larici-populina 98AG31]
MMMSFDFALDMSFPSSDVLVGFDLHNVIRDSVPYTENAKCKTVKFLNVVVALKRQGQTLYVFGA